MRVRGAVHRTQCDCSREDCVFIPAHAHTRTVSQATPRQGPTRNARIPVLGTHAWILGAQGSANGGAKDNELFCAHRSGVGKEYAYRRCPAPPPPPPPRHTHTHTKHTKRTRTRTRTRTHTHMSTDTNAGAHSRAHTHTNKQTQPRACTHTRTNTRPCAQCSAATRPAEC